MSDTVIKVENLSKLYRVGQIGTGTLSHDLNRWWARVRGREDPFAKVGHVNDRAQKAVKGETVWALKDINFEVKQGEVLGIIGKNGAGKSTLLKLLSRVTAPTTGEVKLKGRVASLLEVGTGFHDEMTGRENIYMNGTIMGMTRREIAAKLDDIVDFAGVAKYIDTPTKRYSSGMKVRLGFAVAAFLEPEILIVDEVLAVGDAEFQKRAIGKMQDISKGGGRTVLFVSHNMQTIQQICKNCLVLENGVKDFIGTTYDAIQNYLYNNIGEQKFIVQRDKGVIKFNGIAINNEKKIIDPNHDLEISIQLTTKNTALNNVFIDLAVSNDKDETVIHSRMSWINKPVHLKPLKPYEVQYLIKRPNLSPGKYYLTIFIYSGTEVYLHVKNIYLIEVSAKNYFGHSVILDSLMSNTIPEFSIELS